MNKGFLDTLLEMKSVRFGDHEGDSARCSSCREYTSAKIAVKKYEELLRGVCSSAKKRKASWLNFKKND